MARDFFARAAGRFEPCSRQRSPSKTPNVSQNQPGRSSLVLNGRHGPVATLSKEAMQ